MNKNMKKHLTGIFALLIIISISLCIVPAADAAGSTLSISSPDEWSALSWDGFTVKWNKVTGASGYRISIRNMETDTLIISNIYTTSASYKVSDSVLPEPSDTAKLKIWVGAVTAESDAATSAFTSDYIYVYLSHEPAVTNGGSSSVSATGVSLSMTIDKDHGYDISDYGFYIGTKSSVSSMTKYSYGSTLKGEKTVKITGLEPGTKYYYRAFAENLVGEDYTSYKTFTTLTESISIPVISSPADSQTYSAYQSLLFDWTDSDGADGYRYIVKRLPEDALPDRTNDNEPGEVVVDSTKTASKFTLSSDDMIPGHWYKFVVMAYADGCEDMWSDWVYCRVEETELGEAVITSPESWSDVTGGNSITVKWNAATGATKYTMYWKQLMYEPDTSNDSEPGVNGGVENCGASRTFTLSADQVTAGYWYKFVVAAGNDNGSVSWSNWVYVFADSNGKLGSPVILTPTAGDDCEAGNSIYFSWDEVENATNYTYYVKQLSGEPDYTKDAVNEEAIQLWKGTTGASRRYYILSGDNVQENTWYKFVVQAKASGYDDGWSRYTYIKIPAKEDWVYYVWTSSLTSITGEMFAENSRLRTFDASSSSLESVESRAFANCVNLESIYLPDSVGTIAEDAFYNCPNIVIHCTSGSAAETFATKHGIPVEIHGVMLDADSLTLSSDRWEISTADEEYKAVTVYSSDTWSVSSDQSWLTVSASSGDDGDTLVVSAADNNSGGLREGNLTFTSGDTVSVFPVIQNYGVSDDCQLSVEPNFWAPTSENNSREFYVNSDGGFTIRTNDIASWLTVSTYKGKFVVTVDSSAFSSSEFEVLTIECDDCGTTTEVTIDPVESGSPSHSSIIDSDPAAPSWIKVENTADNDPHALLVSWNKVYTGDSSDEVSYVVERSLNGSTGWETVQSGIKVTSIEDGGDHINHKTTYYYRVAAVVDGETGEYSNTACHTTPAEGTIEFTGEFADINDGDNVKADSLSTLSWNSYTYAAYYRASIALLTNGDEGKPVSDAYPTNPIYGNSTDVTGVFTEGNRYRVWVAAYNDDGHVLAQKQVAFCYCFINVGKDYSSLNDAKDKMTSFTESLEWNKTGLIRFVVQKWNDSTQSEYYYKNYWTEVDQSSGNGKCTRAASSMALSYMGINLLPKDMTSDIGECYSNNVAKLDSSCKYRGGTYNCTTVQYKISYKEFVDYYNKYANDKNGDYSPIIIHTSHSGKIHAFIIIGHDSLNPDWYYLLDSGHGGYSGKVKFTEVDGNLRIDTYLRPNNTVVQSYNSSSILCGVWQYYR